MAYYLLIEAEVLDADRYAVYREAVTRSLRSTEGGSSCEAERSSCSRGNITADGGS